MHEFALAQAVVTAALRAAEAEGMDRVSRIAVRVGELQQIRIETFEFALGEVLPSADARLAGTRMEVVLEPARLRCRACGHAFGPAEAKGPGGEDEREAIHFLPELAHAFLACPACSSPDFEVTAGRGVSIEAVEGEARGA